MLYLAVGWNGGSVHGRDMSTERRWTGMPQVFHRDHRVQAGMIELVQQSSVRLKPNPQVFCSAEAEPTVLLFG